MSLGIASITFARASKPADPNASKNAELGLNAAAY
jgi:hypothetical protein